MSYSNNIKAFILAAGFGSRLKEITNHKPKALVEFNGKPMLEHLLQKLKSFGIFEIAINIHHKGDQIIKFLEDNHNFGLNIRISDERDAILNTGGAILKAKEFIQGDSPVLVHNVDIVSDTDFNELYKYHLNNKSVASLCVRNRSTSRYLLFDKNYKLSGWQNVSTNEIRWVDTRVNDIKKLAYSGIYMIDPEFPNFIKQEGSFSIIDSWLNIAGREKVVGYPDEKGTWHDLGTIERINNAQNLSDR